MLLGPIIHEPESYKKAKVQQQIVEGTIASTKSPNDSTSTYLSFGQYLKQELELFGAVLEEERKKQEATFNVETYCQEYKPSIEEQTRRVFIENSQDIPQLLLIPNGYKNKNEI